MLDQLLKNFRSPGSELRGAAFWAWNAVLEPEKLREQIRTMKKMGLGGFYMHSRTGLDTPYLSERWFECVSSCIDEAEKLGMEAWLYDEMTKDDLDDDLFKDDLDTDLFSDDFDDDDF